jgi:Zn-dependent peptidase ImmA (M78 family)
MKHILTKLKDCFPFLHQRAATEDDFHEFCERHGICVVFTNLISEGVYVIFESKHFIFLNNQLRGRMLRYVMFHELAHYLFHWPSQTRMGAEFFKLGCTEKNHSEAEASAALLLFPAREWESLLQDAEITDSEELKTLIGVRLDIAEKYRV